MKKRVLLPAFLLLLLIAAALWYTRPRTIQQLCPELDLSNCQSITVYSGIMPYVELERMVLEKDSPQFQALMEDLQTRTFSPSLTSLLPRGGRSVRVEDGDFRWELHLEFDRLVTPDGNGHAGQLLHLTNFFGSLELEYVLGNSWRVSTPDQEVWLAQVRDLLIEGQNQRK